MQVIPTYDTQNIVCWLFAGRTTGHAKQTGRITFQINLGYLDLDQVEDTADVDLLQIQHVILLQCGPLVKTFVV